MNILTICDDCGVGLKLNDIFCVDELYYCREHYIVHHNERMSIEDMARRGRPPAIAKLQQKPAVKISDDLMDAVRHAPVTIQHEQPTVMTMSYDTDTVEREVFNEPEHYHKHEIDTIGFLQGGFSPEVYSHFCVGNIVKYAQRYPYKNGRDDLEKIVDYAKRLLEWHDKNNPS